MKKFYSVIFVFIFMLFAVAPAYAQNNIAIEGLPSGDTMSPESRKVLDIYRAALQSATQGPAAVKLGDEATLNLPAGFYFITSPQAIAVLKALGNQDDKNLVGIITPKGRPLDWYLPVDFYKLGYVRDDDAKTWNADTLLKAIAQNTETENKNRAAQGVSQMEVTGWVEKPAYDAMRHSLVYALSAQEHGVKGEVMPQVSYDMVALGRNGIIEFGLPTSSKKLAKDKADAQALLGSITFNPGKTYGDFKPGADAVAPYGLSAIVAGEHEKN